MLKKTLASVGIAGMLVLGGVATGSAAFADNYPVNEGVTISDNTLAPGASAVVTVIGGSFDPGSQVTFSTSGPGVVANTLTSLVQAAVSGSSSVVKTASAEGGATANFTAPTGVTGTYSILAEGVRNGQPASFVVDVSVVAASAGGSTGTGTANGALPATGGDVPVAALWLGVGAIGIGGIAVAAGVARRRANATN